MKPMGSAEEQVIADAMSKKFAEARQYADANLRDDEEHTEIAYPEDRYGVACIGCGIEMHLQMIPHRDQYGLLVGWVFCCEKCRPNIIGRRVWFGNDAAQVQGPSEDWDAMLHCAERLYQVVAEGLSYTEELQSFVDAWDKMLG